MDTREFLDLFLSESREHLDGMSALLARAAAETISQDDINDLFRHAHSLKGMAASMSYRPMSELAHSMEDLFHAWRDGGRVPDRELIRLLQRTSDRLATQVDAIAAGATPPTDADLLAALHAARTTGPGSAAAPDARAAPEEAAPQETVAEAVTADATPPARAVDAPVLICDIRLRAGTPLPAARAQVILKCLAAAGSVEACHPLPESMMGGGFDGHFEALVATPHDPARLSALITGLPDVEDVRVTSLAEEERRTGHRRVLPDRRDESGASSAAETETGGPRSDSIHTIRVSTARMDHLMDGIGELILDRERLKGCLAAEPGSRLGALLEGLDRTVNELRDEVMMMRLIPFSFLSPRLDRSVRDLCRRLGKDVNFTLEGADVSLDRSILEEMLDPLQHIVRNSLDHGIESPEERRRAGKPPTGLLRVDLVRHEDRLTLSVEDDGRGIDPAILRRVAVERGLIDRETADRMSDEEALMLITVPGFSTAARTTDISGRGVGMDVVQTQVRRMGGRLSMRARPGVGTRFEMDLPLTVSVTRAFLCRASDEIYAVPVSAVQTTIEIRHERLQGSQGETLLRRDEGLLTVISLSGVLRGESSFAPSASFPALVYRVGTRSFALAVDEILGQEEIVVKPLRHPLELLPQYSGAAILNDGRIALILDPANLTRPARAA